MKISDDKYSLYINRRASVFTTHMASGAYTNSPEKSSPHCFSLTGNAFSTFCVFTGCVDTKEADIYFLIDGSSSIQAKHFVEIKEFISAVIDRFSIGPNKVRVGVVQYSSKQEEEIAISHYNNAVDLKKAVLNIQQLQGGTLTGAGLNFTLSLIKKGKEDRASDVLCFLIVLTDGQSQDSVLEPVARLKAEKVIIHAIGIGEADKTQLLQIAGKEDRVSFGQNFDSLKNIKNDVVHSICTQKGKQ